MNEEILKELRSIKNLLAVEAIKGLSRKEQILILNGAGFDNKSVAQMVGTTPGTVAVAVSQEKSKRRSGKKNG
ncbi:MAG TPA: hypothetical protein VEH48_01040 [Candidatus Nitrosopolaris sp.]|nr:hypothetical protein [Candidatus Nitrosopolaris sp.]